MDNLLTFKYRPTELENVVGNQESISAIKNLLSQGSIPHLLFTGPPGTGKTTVSKIISKKLILNKKNILELNASDERGIDTVRTTIKNFSHKKTNEIKIIILDECDSMTLAAQQAMRRTIELCSNCRFILICNDIEKITEAIQSRCTIYFFDKIKENEIKKRLIFISKEEKIKIDENVFEIILFLSDNDLRKAINILESVQYLDIINEENILEITGQPSPKIIEKIIISLFTKKDKNEAFDIFDKIWSDGYDSKDLIGSFFKIAKKMENYEILKIIGEYQLRFSKSTATKLQFYALLENISEIQ